MTDFVEFRRAPYDFISPKSSSNDQSGRTVLITGSSEGIGYGIARAYVQANATRVILTSRSQENLDRATQKLNRPNNVLKRVLDASDPAQIEAFWKQLEIDNILIDILILNAAHMGKATGTIADTLKFFKFNVTAKLHVLEHFQTQNNEFGRQKILIDLTSAGIHCYPYPQLAYTASKAAFTNYLCHLADIVPEKEMRIINFHPGAVFTDAARRAKEFPEDLPFWDHPDLSAHMALWLSTPAAAFLHGRFVWANWDAQELVGMKENILADPGFLKMGIIGVNSYGVPKLIEKCKSVPVPRDVER